MGDIGDPRKNQQTAAALWAVWDAQKALAGGADPGQLSPPAQIAYARLLKLSGMPSGLCPCGGTLPGHIRSGHYLPAQQPDPGDPESWLAEYRTVMAEPLALPDGTLDRLAPYEPDPVPGLGRLIKATAPARRRAHPAAMYAWCLLAVTLAVTAFTFWPLAIGAVICMLLAWRSL